MARRKKAQADQQDQTDEQRAERDDADGGASGVAADASQDDGVSADSEEAQTDSGDVGLGGDAGDGASGAEGEGEAVVEQGLPEEDSVNVGEIDPNNYNQASTAEEVGFVQNPVAGGAIPGGTFARSYVNGVDHEEESEDATTGDHREDGTEEASA